MEKSIRIYGLDFSYYTGKLEAYLRYKGLAHDLIPATTSVMERIVLPNTGQLKMPAVQIGENLWLTDTTPMIDWFEARHPQPSVFANDPATDFLIRLLEDFADEWLWRPAMHYRWSYAVDARLMGQRIGQIVDTTSLPLGIRAWFSTERQRRVFVKGDGVTRETWGHVESIYLRTLNALEAIFKRRPFICGDQPSLADFGFAGSMFRHFSQDPTPARIMRAQAPEVYEWTARLWNARSGNSKTDFFVDELHRPFWDQLRDGYIPYLRANAAAWSRKEPRFEVTIEGARYQKLPTSQYRVWALEQLQHRLAKLSAEAHAWVEQVLGEQATAMLEELVARPSLFATNDDPAVGTRLQAYAGQIQRWNMMGRAFWGRPGVRS
ncbi:MAG: glutathione S-transferase family protein [Sphingorhabdus sp.]